MHKKGEGDKQDIGVLSSKGISENEVTFKQRGRRDTLRDRGRSCHH